MSLYLDTSSFVRLLEDLNNTHEIAKKVEGEESVIVSDLVRLETICHFKALLAGGALNERGFAASVAFVEEIFRDPPFSEAVVPPGMISRSVGRVADAKVHCKAVDRLHLVLMQELGLKRLMTHDQQQARAALELGFEVLTP